jgi:pimeloyl-ACP methyl ester carboxylesterase
MGTVTYRKVDVDGIGVFYREAGPKDAPTILLVHGFPPPATCSAISFRNSRTGFTSSLPT